MSYLMLQLAQCWMVPQLVDFDALALCVSLRQHHNGCVTQTLYLQGDIKMSNPSKSLWWYAVHVICHADKP